jgi:type I restriction enzyme M protein
MSESLLAAFADAAARRLRRLPAPDGLWAATMQDDAYLIAADGWVAGPPHPGDRQEGQDQGPRLDLRPDAQALDRGPLLRQGAGRAGRAAGRPGHRVGRQTELEEEHSGDDGVFSGYDSITAAAVKDRIKEIGRDPEGAAELAILKQWLAQTERIAALKKQTKEADAALDAAALARYDALTEADVRALVVGDKWMGRIAADVGAELDRVSQDLSGRVRELAERYALPMAQLTDEVEALAARVETHLRKMGTSWN